MAHAERIPDLVAAEPDLTIAELRSRLAAEGIQASPAAISRILAAEDLRTAARRAPSTPSGKPAARPSTPSPPPSAPTTSPTPAMFRLIENRSSAVTQS